MSKKNIFNQVKMTREKRNTFDLSHDVKLSCNMGDLVPIMMQDVIPGDKWNIGCDSLTRLAPLVAPMMHRCDVTMHYFFVPYRLLWDNWENYITNTKVDDELPAHPYMTLNNASYSKLCDYFGLPTPLSGVGVPDETINAFPFAAYQMIYNEYYRDQNLIEPVPYKLADGENSLDEFNTIRKRAWEHDYLTSALPFAQKGDAVDIPLGDVVYNNPDNNAQLWQQADGGGDAAVGNAQTGFIIGQGTTMTVGGGEPINMDPNGTLEVTPTTINQLRTAFKLQEWLEKAARGGTRYIEAIRSFFGVNSSDKRLQRPEYITGVKSPIIISEVLNMTGTDTAPQGTMAGHGVSVQQGQYGGYYAEEHGCIIGIMSVLPKTAYQQGIERYWLKTTSPFDYYFPQFAHLGEQEIQNREVYAYTNFGSDTFGYTPRYAEYKFAQNRVAGDFRTTLNFWHMGRIFDTVPALNEDFISANPTTRVFAVTATDQDHLYIQILNKIKVSRLMPYYGTPSF